MKALAELSAAPLHLAGGRLIDPATRRDLVADLYLYEGRVVDPAKVSQGIPWQRIDLAGKLVVPGLIDIHVHLREPGGSAKETIATGTRAAAAGGFTTVVAMPNTKPVADGPNTIAWIKQRAAEQATVRVLPTGAISVGLAGEQLAPIASLQKAGVVAITDDGNCIQNNELMRRAMEYARMLNLPILDHCQDYNLSAGGVMNEGYWSTVLGLPGWPAIAEEMVIARNALLCELTRAQLHCQHVTSAGGVRLLREAKQRGIPISGEVTPHHLLLTDAAVQGYDTNFKMNPPLRTERDRQALLEGVADGTIEVLASDHAPHCSYEKEVEFDQAPFGILGLETQLGVLIKALIEPRIIDWPALVSRLTVQPARLLKLPYGTLETGAVADVTVIDPDLEWIVDAERFESKSRNTPFNKMPLRGRAILTIVEGKIVWQL